MGVLVDKLTEKGETLEVAVLDSIGDSYTVEFDVEDEETIQLNRIVLPDDTWDVDVFQEVIEVRDEAIEEAQEEGYTLEYTCMEMNQIMTRSAAERDSKSDSE